MRRHNPPGLFRHWLRHWSMLAVSFGSMIGVAAQDVEHHFPATQTSSRELVIHSATDIEAIAPVLTAFQRIAPDLSIRYREMGTNGLFEESRAACSAKATTADIIISSSVDHLVVLANEGCALPHRSPWSTPAWTHWRGEVFGFTFEPAVIVYNKTLLSEADRPRTRAALIELMRAKPELLTGRIGTYDIALSGIGYLFASFDGRDALIHGRLIEGFGRLQLTRRCCTSDLIREIADGRLLLGYNLLGSYAVGALRQGAPIGIIVPEDYVLALSRAAMISMRAANPDAARRFLDFLLSREGQRVVRENSFFFDFSGQLPDGVEGPRSLGDAGVVRPIVIGPSLLAVQDRARRERFLRDWNKAFERSGALVP
ncbi:MAG: ABC transporter substrate-binding protein [Proteobacteria bacterium]|nr:ABC transporter substrate-binding protein [Pseudomonadota bacterium]